MSRIDRVNQQMKREISGIIQRDLEDPRFEFVTIFLYKSSFKITDICLPLLKTYPL